MKVPSFIKKGIPFVVVAVLVASAALAVATMDRSGTDAPLAAVNAAEVIAYTNEERADDGLAHLRRNSLLDRAAQMKAEDMAKKGYYAHVSPEGVTPVHWVEKVGYAYLIIGENLIVQRTDARQVVDAFMKSPGHRANILRKDFTEIGVGVATGVYKGKDSTFTVQIFAAPRPSTAVATAVPKKSVPAPAVPKVAKEVLPAPKAEKPEPALPTARVAVAVASTTLSTAPIADAVKEALKPLALTATSTEELFASTTATTTVQVSEFFIGEAKPIELASVSRLETQTPPVPLGSVWTARFQVFIDGILLSARSLF